MSIIFSNPWDALGWHMPAPNTPQWRCTRSSQVIFLLGMVLIKPSHNWTWQCTDQIQEMIAFKLI